MSPVITTLAYLALATPPVHNSTSADKQAPKAAKAVASDIIVQEHTVANLPVVIVRPTTNVRLPAVYAIAGLGEMVRGPKASAYGWVEKYGLVEAMTALAKRDIQARHLQGLASEAELAEYRRKAMSYRGIVVICVAAPRRYSQSFRKHLLNDVIPWAERQLPIIKGTGSRGIDGISLGGKHTLQIALTAPESFRTVGTEQASVRGLWPRYKRALTSNPGAYKDLLFHLLTSEQDPFRPPIEAFAGHLKAHGIDVLYRETKGRHDKRFAKGPGAFGMLLFHDRYLARSNTP